MKKVTIYLDGIHNEIYVEDAETGERIEFSVCVNNRVESLFDTSHSVSQENISKIVDTVPLRPQVEE